MVFTRVERDQPHISVINGIVLPVEQFLKCTVVGAVTRDRVHVSRFCLNGSPTSSACLRMNLVPFNSDRDGHAAFVEQFKAVQSDIEQISLTLRDVYEYNLAANTWS